MAAIQRRAPGGSLSGGTPTPALGQVTAPTGTTPAGGPNTPTVPAPTAPPAPIPNAQVGKQVGNVVKGAQAVNGPAFDDETRKISKVLISNLLKYV